MDKGHLNILEQSEKSHGKRTQNILDQFRTSANHFQVHDISLHIDEFF